MLLVSGAADGREKEAEAEQMREKLSAVEEQLRQAEDRGQSMLYNKGPACQRP